MSNRGVSHRFKTKTAIFPWPVALREGVDLRYQQQSNTIFYRHLQSFAELQCVADDACHLNAVLNSPHGRSVEQIRALFSESLYHNWLANISHLAASERDEFVAGLFDDDDKRRRFSTLVDAIYGDENEHGRAPLDELLAVLNSPHGRSVEQIRALFSESPYHGWLANIYHLDASERDEFVAGLFDDDDKRRRFSTLVDALYGDENEHGELLAAKVYYWFDLSKELDDEE